MRSFPEDEKEGQKNAVPLGHEKSPFLNKGCPGAYLVARGDNPTSDIHAMMQDGTSEEVKSLQMQEGMECDQEYKKRS